MIKKVIAIGIVFLLCSVHLITAKEHTMKMHVSDRMSTTPENITKEILVQFTDSTSQNEAEAFYKRLGCSLIKYSQRFNTYHLKIDNKSSVDEIIESFNKKPQVKWAEPNVFVHIEPPKPMYDEEK